MGDILGAITSIPSGIVSAGLNLIGGVATNNANTDIANSANQAAQQIAAQNNAFNAQQFATRYQTTVKDLQAAGLNPMLAYGQGAGSPIAGQAAPVNVPAPRQNVLASASEGFLNARQNAADIKLKDEQANATNAQAEVNRTQALNQIANTAKAVQDTKTSAAVEQVNREQLGSIAAEIELKKQQKVLASATTAKTVMDTAKQKQDTQIQQPLAEKSSTWWGKYVSPYLQDFTSASQAARNFSK